MSLQTAFNPQDWSVLSGALRLKPMAQRDRQRSSVPEPCSTMKPVSRCWTSWGR